ncbi:MAG: 3-deoxy-8-phosphooctulonate synthase [Pseudomonadota bacterium]
MQRTIPLNDFKIGNDETLTIIAGPCQMQTEDHALMIADAMKKACDDAGLNYIYKSSFDKANRTSLNAARGIGLEQGMKLLQRVKSEIGVPVITDIHSIDQCAPVAEVADILQIPAFLSRQTDLLLAAAETGAILNIKKGQFLAPWDMQNVAAKAASTGNDKIMLCERGASFGYNTLVADMRGLPEMMKTGYPVVMDATHSVQQPGGLGGASGGQREFAPVMARAAVSLGIAAVFVETHEDPDNAPCDGPNMIHLKDMSKLMHILKSLDDIAKGDPIRLN